MKTMFVHAEVHETTQGGPPFSRAATLSKKTWFLSVFFLLGSKKSGNFNSDMVYPGILHPKMLPAIEGPVNETISYFYLRV